MEGLDSLSSAPLSFLPSWCSSVRFKKIENGSGPPRRLASSISRKKKVHRWHSRRLPSRKPGEIGTAFAHGRFRRPSWRQHRRQTMGPVPSRCSASSPRSTSADGQKSVLDQHQIYGAWCSNARVFPGRSLARQARGHPIVNLSSHFRAWFRAGRGKTNRAYAAFRSSAVRRVLGNACGQNADGGKARWRALSVVPPTGGVGHQISPATPATGRRVKPNE